ncbi:MAG: hypothetical protein ACKOH8_03490 [Gemmatimonadota bacterium]
MLLLSLAWRSLRNRAVISGLTLLSIALSVALLVGIEHIRRGVRIEQSGDLESLGERLCRRLGIGDARPAAR